MLVCSVNFCLDFSFLVKKLQHIYFKDDTLPLLTENSITNFLLEWKRIMRERRETTVKTCIEIFKQIYVYNPLLVIYQFTTLTQLEEFIGGIQNSVTVVGYWIFDINIPTVLPLTCDNMDYSIVKRCISSYYILTNRENNSFVCKKGDLCNV